MCWSPPNKNIRYQQNLTVRTIALVVLGNPQWPILRLHVDSVVTAVNAASPAVTRKSKYRNNDTGTSALFLVRLSQHSTFVPVPHQRTDSYWRFTGASSRKTPIGGNSGDSQLVRIRHCHGQFPFPRSPNLPL